MVAEAALQVEIPTREDVRTVICCAWAWFSHVAGLSGINDCRSAARLGCRRQYRLPYQAFGVAAGRFAGSDRRDSNRSVLRMCYSRPAVITTTSVISLAVASLSSLLIAT
jgi:hypothetical protein